MWNNFIQDGHGASLPMAVYSEYYRVLVSKREGTENDPTGNDARHKYRSPTENFIREHGDTIAAVAVGGTISTGYSVVSVAEGGEAKSALDVGKSIADKLEKHDLRGQIVYTLETRKFRKKIMQMSWSKTPLNMYCHRGFHMPSTGKLLSMMADRKFCQMSGGTYTGGTCSDMEYAMNELDCVATGGDWTPSSCVQDKKGATCLDSSGAPDAACTAAGAAGDGSACAGGTAADASPCVFTQGTAGGGGVITTGSGILEGWIGTYTDTIHHVALKKTGPDGAESDIINKSNGKFKGDISTALGKGAFYENNSDEFPEKFGVTYNDDTGVCDFGSSGLNEQVQDGVSFFDRETTHVTGSSAWCDRMGMDTHVIHDEPSLYQGQTYIDCDTGMAQDVLEGLCGKHCYRTFKNAAREAHELVVDGEKGIGGFMDSSHWTTKAGGGIHDSGSLAYALDGHEGERLGHDIGPGAEKVGRVVDKVIHSSVGYLIPIYGEYKLISDIF